MNKKQLIKKIFLLCQGDSLLRMYNRVPRILFWHGVDNILDSEIESESIKVSVFKEQIAYLKRYYEIISIEEFEKRLLCNTFSGREVVLTFDDGYANNLRVVAPILGELHLPFTVFVSTDHIDQELLFPTSVARLIIKGSSLQQLSLSSLNRSFDLSTEESRATASIEVSRLLKTLTVDDVKVVVHDMINNLTPENWGSLVEKYKSVLPMSWSEVAQLSKMELVTIGSHCMYHICCHQNQNVTEVERQIRKSKSILEEKLGIECKYFAYPNGDYTTKSNSVVSSCYHLGFSTKGNERISVLSKRAIIPRIGVPDSLETFKIILNLNPKCR